MEWRKTAKIFERRVPLCQSLPLCLSMIGGILKTTAYISWANASRCGTHSYAQSLFSVCIFRSLRVWTSCQDSSIDYWTFVAKMQKKNFFISRFTEWITINAHKRRCSRTVHVLLLNSWAMGINASILEKKERSFFMWDVLHVVFWGIREWPCISCHHLDFSFRINFSQAEARNMWSTGNWLWLRMVYGWGVTYSWMW